MGALQRTQKVISFRLTALRHINKFNVNTLREVKVCYVLGVLLRWSATLNHDIHRLWKRTQRLSKRVTGTVNAYRRAASRLNHIKFLGLGGR